MAGWLRINLNKNCKKTMAEFWEETFKGKQEMWGMQPVKSAKVAAEFFQEKALKNILIPGIGYGRNAKPFLDAGMQVRGIEISQTAIDLAKKHFGDTLKIHHGSVCDMPFDNEKYDGIFSYGLLHLLSKTERKKHIEDCYSQLATGGYMVFAVISKKAEIYGKGKLISQDRYEIHEGAKIFFYDLENITKEYGEYGLFETEVHIENFPFYLVKCKKNND
jgi:cyclopropane fatty-acyl-phospholipid synthase-like methyltransferase